MRLLRVLLVTPWQAIHDGDSGSWIVDCDTMELYGHLVATGIFDEGIVVPMKNIFDDIKDQFCAISVTLPTVIDILSKNLEVSQVTTDVDHKIEHPLRFDSGYSSFPVSPEQADDNDEEDIPRPPSHTREPLLGLQGTLALDSHQIMGRYGLDWPKKETGKSEGPLGPRYRGSGLYR